MVTAIRCGWCQCFSREGKNAPASIHLCRRGSTITIGLPRLTLAESFDRTLRYVPAFNLSTLDPLSSTSGTLRMHGYMIYDTLYGVSTSWIPSFQMAADHAIEDDGRRWTIRLREGLTFHSGEKVRAQDAAASIRRWMKRNTFGQALEDVTDEVSALDDQRVVFRLKNPFPMLAFALANPGQPAFIMPERVAQTDPFKHIQDTTGSGPFRFKADEFNSGSFVAYERNLTYRPIEFRPA